MMPKLDLLKLSAAKGAAGTIKAMKGAGWSWVEPTNLLPSRLYLDQAPSLLTHLEIVSVGKNQLRIAGPANTRRAIVWDVLMPRGTRLMFEYRKLTETTADRLWTRSTTAADASVITFNFQNGVQLGQEWRQFDVTIGPTNNGNGTKFAFLIADSISVPADIEFRNFQMLPV